MAAGTFELEVATPEKLVIKATCKEATIPGADGYLGILPHHAPLLSRVGSGLISYRTVEGQEHKLAVHGGYLEIQSDVVRVLADAAERPDEVDAARAQEAMKRAQDRIAKLPPNVDLARALNALKRAQTRVEVSRGK